MSSIEDDSNGKPRATPNKLLKSKKFLATKQKHKNNNNQSLIESLIRQQAIAKEQARLVDEQLLALLNSNKKYNIRKSKCDVEEEENEDNELVDEPLLQSLNSNKKHNIRKSKRIEEEKDNETEEEDNTEDEDEVVDDDDDANVAKKKLPLEQKQLHSKRILIINSNASFLMIMNI